MNGAPTPPSPMNLLKDACANYDRIGAAINAMVTAGEEPPVALSVQLLIAQGQMLDAKLNMIAMQLGARNPNAPRVVLPR